jgi:CDP-glucose 4,6-dehydratase
MSFNKIFKDKTIIVTGNTGFKGAWLSVWLHNLGAKVVGISKDIPTKPSLFEELQLVDKMEHHYINVTDAKAIETVFKNTQPDFVFHLAAQPIVSTSYSDPLDTFNTNVMGTANVLEALKSLTKPCKVVMITSDKCYDNVEWIWGYRENDAVGGKDPYSASKGAAELVIKSYFHSYFNKPDSNIALVAVRAGNVIGGGDWALNRIVPDCFRAWNNNEPVVIRSPNATRPWQHVLEPLSGYLRAAQVMAEKTKNINGEAFNFGPDANQNKTVLELLQTISTHWDFTSLTEYFNIENNTSFHEAGLLKLNCDKALTYLQWQPVLAFDQTAAFTGSWYNHYYNKNKSNLYELTSSQIEAYISFANTKSIAWAL